MTTENLSDEQRKNIKKIATELYENDETFIWSLTIDGLEYWRDVVNRLGRIANSKPKVKIGCGANLKSSGWLCGGQSIYHDATMLCNSCISKFETKKETKKRKVPAFEWAETYNKGYSNGFEDAKEKITKLIMDWDRCNKWGTAIRPYKEWARLESFGNAYYMLLSRIKGLKE